MIKCKRPLLSAGRLIQLTASLLLMLLTNLAQAQEKVSGQVKDKSGNPVQGASVSVKSKNINTLTGADGKFSIAAASGDVLVISSVAYETTEVAVTGNGMINVEMATSIRSLDDVVVVGYG